MSLSDLVRRLRHRNSRYDMEAANALERLEREKFEQTSEKARALVREAELERELAEARSKIERLTARGIEDLQHELAEARKDTERLEWYFRVAVLEHELRLTQQNGKWGWMDASNLERSTPRGDWFGWYEHWRDAIDAAKETP